LAVAIAQNGCQKGPRLPEAVHSHVLSSEVEDMVEDSVRLLPDAGRRSYYTEFSKKRAHWHAWQQSEE
jgi:hypothetical protein